MKKVLDGTGAMGYVHLRMEKEQSFSEELRAWLKKRNWVQKEGAAALGVSLDTFRSWIHDHRVPSETPSIREVREKMAGALEFEKDMAEERKKGTRRPVAQYQDSKSREWGPK